MKHLVLDLIDLHYAGVSSHPQQVMKNLGITYQHSTPQSIADCWWFWNCENIPEKLPSFLRVLNVDPMKSIGFGLDLPTAERIRDYKPYREEA